MHTHLEFRSPSLLDPVVDDGTTQGERVARLLAARLPDHGYAVEQVHAEDWGWRIQIAHSPFPLWIGCGAYLEYEDGHLCFIEPLQPYIRRWFKRISTAAQVEALAAILEQIVRGSGIAHNLRWWSDIEVAGL